MVWFWFIDLRIFLFFKFRIKFGDIFLLVGEKLEWELNLINKDIG